MKITIDAEPGELEEKASALVLKMARELVAFDPRLNYAIAVLSRLTKAAPPSPGLLPELLITSNPTPDRATIDGALGYNAEQAKRQGADLYIVPAPAVPDLAALSDPPPFTPARIEPQADLLIGASAAPVVPIQLPIALVPAAAAVDETVRLVLERRAAELAVDAELLIATGGA